MDEVLHVLPVGRLSAPLCHQVLWRLAGEVCAVHGKALPGVQIPAVLQLCHHLKGHTPLCQVKCVAVIGSPQRIVQCYKYLSYGQWEKLSHPKA